MIASSVLGKLYFIWLQSAIYGFFFRLAQPFRRAWSTSAFARFFKRRGALEGIYQSSLAARLLRGVSSVSTGALSHLCTERDTPFRRFRRRFFDTSYFLSYESLLGGFICLMFIIPHGSWNNAYALAGAVFFLALHALLVAAGRRESFSADALGLPFSLFALACALSLLFTTGAGDSLRVFSFFVTAFLLTFELAAVATNRDAMMKLLGFIYFAVMLTALYAVAQRLIGVAVDELLTDVDINQGVPGRVYSTLGNPNNYAEFLVLFTPLCAVWAVNVKNRPLRLVFCLGVLLPMLALVMTYSRSGWLSIVLAACVFVFFADRKLIPLLFFVCVALFPFLPGSVLTRLSTIFNASDTSASHRIYVWQGVLLMLADRSQWLTGIGLGPETFANVYPEYARRWAMEGVYHSQMLYLDLIIETGALGFVSFMWLMLRTVRDSCVSLWQTHSPLTKGVLIACAASFVGISLAGIVEYIWFYPRDLFAFFILLGLCFGALRSSQSEKVIVNE